MSEMAATRGRSPPVRAWAVTGLDGRKEFGLGHIHPGSFMATGRMGEGANELTLRGGLAQQLQSRPADFSQESSIFAIGVKYF